MAASSTSSSSTTSQSEEPPDKPLAAQMLPETALYFIAGGAAGATSRTIVSPLERLKIIMQCQGPQRQYRGVFHGLVLMWQQEGWRGYMRGNGINVIRIAPYSAVQFTSYEYFKKLATANGTTDFTTPLRLLCGASAGICSVVSTYPLDLVRSRLSIMTATIGHAGMAEIERNKAFGIKDMAVKVYKEEGGIRALYRGLVPTAVGVAPYVGLNFLFYSRLRDWMADENDELGVFTKLACGAIAGAISQTFTYVWTVVSGLVTSMDTIDFKYNGAIEAAFSIIKNEGLRGLYRGIWPNLVKVAPAIGTSFATYEAVKKGLGAS